LSTINSSNFGTGIIGQVLTSNGAGIAPTFQPGGGQYVSHYITQANTFTVGQVVYLNAGVYTLAKADSVVTAEVVGIVTVAGNPFVLVTSGYITGLSGFAAGTVYFLSDVTAGLLTATQPTTVGNISKPLFVADSATSGYFINYRGKVIPAASTAVVWNNVTTSSVTMVAYNGYICDNGASQITFTIPATAVIGDTFSISGNTANSSGGWIVQCSAGQTIATGRTTSAATGNMTSALASDAVSFICQVANTTFATVSIIGSPTIT